MRDLSSQAASVQDQPLTVVTSDSHVSPSIETQLRPYCPKNHQQDLDNWLNKTAWLRDLAEKAFVFGGDESLKDVHDIHTWNLQTEGHRDIHARLADMNRDGVAAEVIFHGSAPFAPIPFITAGFGIPIEDYGLAEVGQRMYNQWLADFCSVEPERHVGLAHLPIWDIDKAVKEAEWARNAGLRGVNFPSPRQDITPYEDPAWDKFWSACADLDMVLASHGGGGDSTPLTTGPTATYIYTAETNAFSRVSPLVRLVFGGVFERHPKLKLVQTEQVGDWYGRVLDELDSIWEKFWYGFTGIVPKKPSEYCRANYFVGASFQSRAEAEAAVHDNYFDNIMWGSDYPHPEGTYHYPSNPDEEPMTRQAMRCTYAGLPAEAVRAMLGDNGVRVYGLDADMLAQVAARINAPTLGELSNPLEKRPNHWSTAFRTTATYV